MDKSDYVELSALPREDLLIHDTEHTNTQGSHCHTFRTENPGVDKTAQRKLFIAVILCFFFVIGQTIGGIMANSLAIATDAAHMLTDFFGYCINLVALYLSVRPSNKRLHFGWYRIQVLGALSSILLIWAVTAVLAYVAVLRIIAQNFELDPKIMLLMAGLGVIFNLIMLLSLNVDSHHSNSPNSNSPNEHDRLLHNLDDNAEVDNQQKIKSSAPRQHNISVLAAVIHVVGDLLQCIGVLIAAIMIYFKPEWKLADPVCTFLFCVIVLTTTLAVLRDIIIVLMEGAPRGIKYDEIKESLRNIQGVRNVHNLHVWSLTLNQTAVLVHLAVDKTHDAHRLQEEAWQLLLQDFHISESTVQVEQFTEDMLHCEHCKDPKE